MARGRIAVMSGSCLLALAATLASAQAQTTGAPLQLLRIDHAKAAVHVRHPASARIARTKPTKAEHRRIARHIGKSVHAKTRIADAGHDLPAPPTTAPATPQNDAQNLWPTPTTAALGYAATPKMPDGPTAAVAPSAAPGSVTTEQVVDTDPNGILNGGRAVPAAMPPSVAPAPAASKPQPAAAAKPAAAPASPPMKVATASPAMPKSPVHAMLFRPSVPSAVGSVSWIAQLLAALGGAIAAGAVAWFLIRPAPERNFG